MFASQQQQPRSRKTSRLTNPSLRYAIRAPVLIAWLTSTGCGAPGAPSDSDPSTSPEIDESPGQTTFGLGSTWCRGANQWLHFGDFNGDGRTDLACHRRDGQNWFAYANVNGNFDGAEEWAPSDLWCSTDFRTGDFNGDGRDDLLCHGYDGELFVVLADLHGRFNFAVPGRLTFDWCDAGYTVQPFDQFVLSTLTLGDFDGNGLTDLMCTDPYAHHAWIMYAQRSPSWPPLARRPLFTGTGWEGDLNWCLTGGHGTYETYEMHAGRLNQGDNRDDLLCGQGLTEGGRNGDYALFSDALGRFSPPSDNGHLFDWCKLYDERLYVGDFNGDGLMDLLCHSRLDGHKWIAQAPFTPGQNPTTWDFAMGWCHGPNSSLNVADFNGDHHDDLFCYEQVGADQGKKWIAYAKQMPGGAWGFTGTDWESF